MAQTELMLRLLKDGKIVGYEHRKCAGIRHPNMSIFHKVDLDLCGRDIAMYLDDRVNYINHDSFELGIKVGDEIWFEGDILCYIDEPESKHTLVYDGKDCRWYLVSHKTGNHDSRDFPLVDFKRIGNIHDNKTEGEGENEQ